jgi:flagellar assembly protein FliH
MPLLKATADSRPFLEFSMTDIEREAAALLEGAKRRAEAIQARGREEAERAKAAAYEVGFAEGRAAGHAEGLEAGRQEGRSAAHEKHLATLSQLAESLDAILRAFNADREQLAARAGNEVPHLAVAIAGRVVKRAAAVDPGVCIANSTAALRLVMRAHDVKLLVHPDDFSTIKDLLPEFGRRWPALTHIELLEDADLHRGGCRVQTAGGLVDADLQAQLDRIAKDLIPDEAG